MVNTNTNADGANRQRPSTSAATLRTISTRRNPVPDLDMRGLNVNTQDDLNRIISLRHFEVDYWRRPRNWPSIIDSWTKIKRLEIDMWGADKEIVRKALMSHNITWLYIYNPSSFPKTPNTLNQPFRQNLVELLISKTGDMDAGTMEFLGKFPKLRKLTLMEIGQSMVEISFDDKAFTELRYLKLSEMFGLQKIKIGESSLPNLIMLKVSGCKNLEMVSEDGLRYLHKLRDVQLGNCGMSGLIASCRKHHHHYPMSQ